MLALAVGYLRRRPAFRCTRPACGASGCCCIAAGVATLPVVLFGNAALDWIFDRVADPRYGSLHGVRAAVLRADRDFRRGVAVRGPRLLVSNLHASGKSAGLLYFVSTFGSAAGTILTSFYLVLLFEVNTILLGLMTVSVALGLARGPASGIRAMSVATSFARSLPSQWRGCWRWRRCRCPGPRAPRRALALPQHRRRTRTTASAA